MGAERLRVFLGLCADQGITQQRWAIDVGIKNEHLSRLAHGARLPSMEQAWHLERITRGFVKMQHWMQPGATPPPRGVRQVDHVMNAMTDGRI